MAQLQVHWSHVQGLGGPLVVRVDFLPCRIGGNQCRLTHSGWEQCGHGLSSRPKETADHTSLGDVSNLFVFPDGIVKQLLACTLSCDTAGFLLPASFPLGLCPPLGTWHL